MFILLVVLGVIVCLAGCHGKAPTEPTKTPYNDHQTCLDAGGQWGPWITHYGCKLPQPEPGR